MKILHLTTVLQGGAGRVVVDLALEQQRAGHDTTVVASRMATPGSGNFGGYVEELETAGVSLRLIDSTLVRESVADLAVVRCLDELYAPGDEPDVIHTHAATPSLVALLFAGTRRRPMTIVQTMHGWDVTKSPEQLATEVALLNLVDRVAVPSQHAASTIGALGVESSRTVLVPYGVHDVHQSLSDGDQPVCDAMARARRRGALVVACVGTIGSRNNHAVVIDALAFVQPHLETCCVFVGDGDVDGLRASARAAEGCGEIHVHGYTRAPRRMAAHADLLVLSPRGDSQPVALLEAFCDRTIVAVSDVPGLVELMGADVTGFQFANGDAHSLADVLVRVSRQPAAARREMQARARALYFARFTTSAMTAAYLGLYEAAHRDAAPAHRPRVSSAA